MHDPQYDGGLYTEQDEEVHGLSQEPLQGRGDGVLPSWDVGIKTLQSIFGHLNAFILLSNELCDQTNWKNLLLRSCC